MSLKLGEQFFPQNCFMPCQLNKDFESDFSLEYSEGCFLSDLGS